MKIYLSPSDQRSNRTKLGFNEAEHCYKIAKMAESVLLQHGYQVLVGDNTKEKSYTNRVKESNLWGADLHVCIHTDAGGGKGTTMFCYDISSSLNKYLINIYNEVATLTPTKDRGIKVNKTLYEITATSAMCAYLECEFHDNLETDTWIVENIDNIGKAIANGIIKADKKHVNTDKIYRVQSGAFKDMTNAENYLKLLKSKGIDGFIV